MKDCPVAISGSKEFTALVTEEDLKSGLNSYLMGHRLPDEDSEKTSSLPMALGFLLPILLISLTLFLLYLFQNRLF